MAKMEELITPGHKYWELVQKITNRILHNLGDPAIPEETGDGKMFYMVTQAVVINVIHRHCTSASKSLTRPDGSNYPREAIFDDIRVSLLDSWENQDAIIAEHLKQRAANETNKDVN